MPATSLRLRWKLVLDSCQRRLDAHSTRLVLSTFILVSVLPESAQREIFPAALVDHFAPFFLAVFAVELAIRVALYRRRWQERQARGWEALLLVLDLLAVISFLPLESTIGASELRLLRLTRMLLLLGYWGRMARELFAILLGPERRYQVMMVLFLGVVLSFGSAVLISHLAPRYDFDGDGHLDVDDADFFSILWWSFRQVQDPGNLVSDIGRPSIVMLSLLLTLAGLLLFSFLIGIGTSAIEELLARAREQPVGLHDHTVILGLTPHSELLMEELAMIYRKNLRTFRAAVLGDAHKPPAYLHRPLLRSFQYRHGNPVRVADLDRVNVQEAQRVLILGNDPIDPDGEVIAAVLATRERNPKVDLYPDIEHERNFRAVRAAGGPGTHLVGSGSFLGHYIVQNVLFPGSYRIHRHLMTSAGCEIYTYFFSDSERRRLCRPERRASFEPLALHRLAYHEFGVTWIGLFVAEPGDTGDESPRHRVLLNPHQADRSGDVFDSDGRVRWQQVRGLFGIALRWEDLRRLTEFLIDNDALGGPPVADPSPSPLAVSLMPPRRELRRVLVCGTSLRIPRVVLELTAFTPELDVTVAIPDPRRFDTLARALRERLTDVWRSPVEIIDESGRLELRRRSDSDNVRVLVLSMGWRDRRLATVPGAVELESADAVLLLPGTSSAESLDGSVALDCLKIANLVRSGAVAHRRGLHILGMVRDPAKGDLLESRLARIAGDGGDLRFSIISSERARHHFIMQNVFVRGLNSLYLEMLGSTGQQLGRFEVHGRDGERPAGGVDFGTLISQLLDRRLIFVGFEAVDPDSGERQLELDPRRMPAGDVMPWETVRALYVLGSPEDLATLSDL